MRRQTKITIAVAVCLVALVAVVNHKWIKSVHKERAEKCGLAKNKAESILRQNDLELIRFQRCHFYHAEYTAKDESGRIYMVDVWEDGHIAIQNP
jgi:phosphoribulokinase